jgi:hypothetical protein
VIEVVCAGLGVGGDAPRGIAAVTGSKHRFEFTPEEDWNALGPRPWGSLDAEQQLRRVRAVFHHAAIGEIRRSIDHIKIGSAILSFCALDFLSALDAGVRSSKKTFKGFCGQYLTSVNSQYDPKKLWNTRCRLVHNYSLKGVYYVSWEQGVPAHLTTPTGLSSPVLVLEKFIDDIEVAGGLLFLRTLTDESVAIRVLTQAGRAEPLGFGTSVFEET